MASKRSLGYSFRFYKGGRRIALSKLRYATSFELWYGRKRIVAPKPFLKSQAKLEARRKYLANLTKRIEVGRLQAIADKKKAKERKLKAELAAHKKLKTKQTRKTRIQPQKPSRALPEERAVYDTEIDWAFAGLPEFKKAYWEPSPEFKNVEVRDTIIIPIQPDSHRYNKKLVEKAMWSSGNGNYDLSIMDFTMIPEEYFAMEGETFSDCYTAAWLTFAPHIMNYFENIRKSTDLFTLRIKFMWQGDAVRDQPFSTQGLSLSRMQIRSREGMLELIRDTFHRFFGPQDLEIKRGVRGKRNYLVGDRVVLITGFTLEGVTYE